MVREKGKMIKGQSFNVLYYNDLVLNNSIYVGFTATKRLGKAFKRNKANNVNNITQESANLKAPGSTIGISTFFCGRTFFSILQFVTF